MPRKKQSGYTKAQIYKIRYWIYRELGFTPAEARKMRSRELDVNNIKLDEKGKVNVNEENFKKLKNNYGLDLDLVAYKTYIKNVPNDTIHKPWGMLTHDDRYKDETAKMTKLLEKKLNISNDQAYYFLYFAIENDMSYQETYDNLMGAKDFESYDDRKKQRIERQKMNSRKYRRGL